MWRRTGSGPTFRASQAGSMTIHLSASEIGCLCPLPMADVLIVAFHGILVMLARLLLG